jgi:uncharacterized repeat protein (TIGR03803 family)
MASSIELSRFASTDRFRGMLSTARLEKPVKRALICALETLLSCVLALGQTGKVLHSFSGSDGYSPEGNMVLDSAGNLYGTTYNGGSNSGFYCYSTCGVAFELSPSSDGTWTETVLYNFCSLTNCVDGALPNGGLVLDSVGNLYGTTLGGGLQNNCLYEAGCGVVFELSPQPDGTWTETVLYSFTGGADGENPAAGLIFDNQGNLYGVTGYSGPDGTLPGIVFELSPTSGFWAETVLYSFTSAESGHAPESALIFDPEGNLYGTTTDGGDLDKCNGGCGVVFQLKPSSSGPWMETVLHAFDGSDGYYPVAGLSIDSAGNLFGTTEYGGNHACPKVDCGVVFELVSAEAWHENVIYSFSGGDGENPWANLTFGPGREILYGTTIGGGATGRGTVFALIPQTGGGWSEKEMPLVTKFGRYPEGGLTLGLSGQLFGSSSGGGSGQGGTVFEIIP